MTCEAILAHKKCNANVFVSMFTVHCVHCSNAPVIRKSFWNQRQFTNPIQLIFPLHVHNLSISIQFLVVAFNPNRIQSRSMRMLKTEKIELIVMCVKWNLWPLHFSFFSTLFLFCSFFRFVHHFVHWSSTDRARCSQRKGQKNKIKIYSM